MNREKAWDIITLLCFIDLLLLVFKVFSASPIKEPEFINSYCIMTSDDSFELLPKEIGTINSYQNNSPKLSSVVDKVSPKQSVAMGLYRIVRFNASKKDRHIQWMEFSPTLFSSKKAQKSGYVNFIAHQYGSQSYTLTFPEYEMIPGEYGIFLSAVNGRTIPIGTFSIPK